MAVITCIAPAHLEGLGSIEGVAREKLSLLEHLRPGGKGTTAAARSGGPAWLAPLTAFLDAFTERAEWRDVPVVVITAKELTPAERERLLGQAQKVIAKSASIRADIAAAVSEAVRRRPAHAEAGARA